MADRGPTGPTAASPTPLFQDLRFSGAGAWTLFAGVLFLGAGVVASSWTVTLWGQVILGVVVVARLAASRDEQALHNGDLRLSVEPPGGGRVGRKLPIGLTVQGVPGRTELRLSAAAELGVTAPLKTVEAPGSVEVIASPVRAGRPFLHGVRMVRRPWPGLFEAEAWFPLNQSIQVLPGIQGRVGLPSGFARTDDLEEASRRVSRAGIGSEFREIRDHRPGDAYRAIAWKASARRGRLLVREFDDESRVTLRLLLDTSPSMRAGEVGRTPLDAALSLCARVSESLLSAGDRVGLVTFDRRTISVLQPGAGKVHRRRLLTTFPDIFGTVAPDLVAPDPADIERRVAEHVRYQRGLEVNRDGRVDDELLDAVTRHLLAEAGVKLAPAADPVREYCRHFGPALPYRATESAEDLDRGLADSVAKSLEGRRRPSTLLLVSDLQGRPGDGLTAALSTLRRRRHRLLVLAPSAALHLPRPDDGREARIHDLVAWSADPGATAFARRLKAAGVPIVTLGPGDPLSPLLRRLARIRAA